MQPYIYSCYLPKGIHAHIGQHEDKHSCIKFNTGTCTITQDHIPTHKDNTHADTYRVTIQSIQTYIYLKVGRWMHESEWMEY